ncbi:MAG: glycosyltransferase [Coriobacteriia bacterium]|nr:glycosyltransferase [Coriobacteriia bacterium]
METNTANTYYTYTEADLDRFEQRKAEGFFDATKANQAFSAAQKARGKVNPLGIRAEGEGPLVSVVVPTYNTAPFLDQALNSISNQTYKNLEILCINDGSTDNSLDIMKAHAKDDPRIRIVDKQNEGYGASCNRGIAESHGDWIAILEPDDWILPTMYEDMLEFASGFEETIDIIKTPYWRYYMPDTKQEQQLPCSYKDLIRPAQQPFVITDAIHLFHHHPSIWSALYRKDFLTEHDIHFLPIPGAGWADNPFLAETMLQAKNIIYLDQAYYCYREETADKNINFHKNSPMVPFDRWNDMMDVIERLGVTDERILCAHYSRGFMYMGGVLEQHSADDPEIRAQIERMFNRMDPALVFEYPYIAPNTIRLFAEVRGIENPPQHRLRYTKNLVSQGAFNLRHYGMKQTWISVSRYFLAHRKRSGNR